MGCHCQHMRGPEGSFPVMQGLVGQESDGWWTWKPRSPRGTRRGVETDFRLPLHVFLCVSLIHKRISGFLGQVQENPRVDFTGVCRKLVVCLPLFFLSERFQQRFH